MRRLALITLALLALVGTSAQAELEGLTLSTDYPSQIVSQGETLTFSIDIGSRGLASEIVTLEMAEAPEDWQPFFLGRGRAIRSVFVPADGTNDFDFQIEVPEDAEESTYEFLIRATTGQVEATLPIELTVGEVRPAQLEMDVELPILQGSVDSSFDYRADVRNDSGRDMLVSFEAQTPEGFQVNISRGIGGEEITSLPIEAGQSENVTFRVDPADRVAAGEYPIVIRAVGDGITTEMELTAVVTGTPELAITGRQGRLSGRVTKGATSSLEVLVQNQGTSPAEGIQVDASEPQEWTVEFEPSTIEQLGPGEQISVNANITAAEQAVAGDYMLTVRANPQEGDSASADFRLTLETSTQWGIVGLVLIAAALGVVALAVSRFGRR